MTLERKRFEEKMNMVKEKNGMHPKTQLMCVGGPEFADQIYEAMFAVFMQGVEYGRFG